PDVTDIVRREKHAMHPITAALFIVTASFLTASSEAQEVVTIPSERIFVPTGFDDNDNAQVILDGYLERSCDTLISPAWNLDMSSFQISVSARVLRDHTIVCTEERRPFTQVVNLGVLPMGKYRVWTNRGRLIKPLVIAEAPSASKNETYYASLIESYVEHNPHPAPGESQWSVVLRGYFEDSCQQWDFVEVDVGTFIFAIMPVVTPANPQCEAEFT